jgi:hypothetical protein
LNVSGSLLTAKAAVLGLIGAVFLLHPLMNVTPTADILVEDLLTHNRSFELLNLMHRALSNVSSRGLNFPES